MLSNPSSISFRCSSDRQLISHSKGVGTLKKPGIILVVGSITDPSGFLFFRMLKPQRILEITMKRDFSARWTPGHARLWQARMSAVNPRIKRPRDNNEPTGLRRKKSDPFHTGPVHSCTLLRSDPFPDNVMGQRRPGPGIELHHVESPYKKCVSPYLQVRAEN